jgi:pyruvate dehydrogenase E1 component
MKDAERRAVDATVLDRVSRHARTALEPGANGGLVAAVTALYGFYLDPADRVIVHPDALSACRVVRDCLGVAGHPLVASASPAATLLAAATRRHVDEHFGARPRSRFVGILGAADLDEDFWTLLAEHLAEGASNVLLVLEGRDGVRQRLERSGCLVTEVRFGPRLRAAFAACPELEDWLRAMPPDRLRSMMTTPEGELRLTLLDGAPVPVWTYVGRLPDDELAGILHDLAGDDQHALLDAYAAAAASPARVGAVVVSVGPGSPEADADPLPADLWPILADRATFLGRLPSGPDPWRAVVPTGTGASANHPTSTHAAFLRSLRALAREPGLQGHLVVAEPEAGPPVPSIESLGLAREVSGQPLLPAGVCDSLASVAEASLAAASGSRFVLAGEESAIGVPQLTLLEPAYAVAVDWLLCAALAEVGGEGRGSVHIRVSRRPVDQEPFAAARERMGDAVLRGQVLSGAYRLLDGGSGGGPAVQIAASGTTLPEAVAAARELAEEGVRVHLVDVVSPDLLYGAWLRTQRYGIRTATTPALPGVLRQAFEPRVPVVTVHDATPYALAWLGSALGVPAVAVPTSDVDPGSMVNAALAALSLR